jgi:hypothetical protein
MCTHSYSGFRMSGKLTALTYSTYTVRHAVTLKWLPIVFVRLIQSQRIVMATAKHRTATARNTKSALFTTGNQPIRKRNSQQLL